MRRIVDAAAPAAVVPLKFDKDAVRSAADRSRDVVVKQTDVC